MTGLSSVQGDSFRADKVFVGREDLFAELADTPVERVRIVYIHGTVGSGKSRFIEEACERLRTFRPMVLRIAIGEQSDPRPERGSPTELLEAHRDLRRVVTKLVSDVKSIEKAAGRREEDVNHALYAAESELSAAASQGKRLKGNTTAEGLEERVRHSQGILSEAFSDSMARLLGGRSALVTLDNFERVADRTLRDWLIDLVGQLERTVSIVARTPETPGVACPAGADCLDRRMPALTLDDIEKYLKRCLPEDRIDEPLVKAVAAHTEGLAESVWLLARVGREHGLRAMRDEAARPPQPRPEQVAAESLVAQEDALAMRTIADTPCEEIVQSACVLRGFDARLLSHVLERTPGECEELINTLDRHELLVADIADESWGFMQLKPRVREAYDARLRERPGTEWRTANTRAAEYIYNLLVEYQERSGYKDIDSLGAWRRYEQPRWQALFRDQLYYEARAVSPDDEHDLQASRSRFARGFLDAFFWWGCYEKFQFLTDLLDDWRATQEDDGLATALRTLVAKYPTGYRKELPPEAWDEIRRALLNARRLCGLRARLDGLNEDRRHLWGLLQVFLAHTWRYRLGDDAAHDEKALGHYDAALDAFRLEEDGWTVGWILFERAEVHARRDRDRARADWAASAALLADDEDLKGDHELAANLHRLAADVRWPESPQDAFAAHSRAVLHAHLFQGQPQPAPDSYTRAFYCEQVERALDRLVEHARAGGDPTAAVAVLRSALPPSSAPDADELARFCAEDDRAALSQLLPEPPREEDQEDDSSPFMSDWSEFVDAVEDPDATAEASRW